MVGCLEDGLWSWQSARASLHETGRLAYRRSPFVDCRLVPADPFADHQGSRSAHRVLSNRNVELGDRHGLRASELCALIIEAEPEVVEQVKWKKPYNPAGVPVWEHAGIVCTGETYRDKVKLTFARGAALPDPMRLFNASLDGNQRRAIDVHEGDKIDEDAFKALIRAAVALNTTKAIDKRRFISRI